MWVCVSFSPYLSQHGGRQPRLEEKLPCLFSYRKRQKIIVNWETVGRKSVSLEISVCISWLLIYMCLCVTAALMKLSVYTVNSCHYGDVKSCLYLRHSPSTGRGCRNSDHVCPSPQERWPKHLDHLKGKGNEYYIKNSPTCSFLEPNSF